MLPGQPWAGGQGVGARGACSDAAEVPRLRVAREVCAGQGVLRTEL